MRLAHRWRLLGERLRPLACSVSATAAKQGFRPFTTEKRTAFLNTLSRGQPQRAPAKPLTVPSDVGAFGRRIALAPLIPRALVGIAGIPFKLVERAPAGTPWNILHR